MYLVDKKYIVWLEGSEDAGKVARFIEHRSARELKADSELVGNDVRERRLAQARRAMQERVVEGFSAIFRRLDEDAEVLDDFALPAEVLEAQRPERILEVLFLLTSFLSYVEIFHWLMGLMGLMELWE